MGYCSCGNWVDEGSICDHCGSALTYDEPNEEEDVEEFDHYISRDEYYYRQAKACSIKGDHSTAIKFYKEALNIAKSKEIYVGIADEYEAIGDYDNALYYWDELCARYRNHSNLRLKGDFLYRIWRDEDSIATYKEALVLLESKVGELGYGGESPQDYLTVTDFIIDTYKSMGKYDLAENYREESKRKINGFINKNLMLADSCMEEGEFSTAKSHCQKALEYDPNNIKTKRKFDEYNKIFELNSKEQNKLKNEINEKKKLEEKKKKREQERIAREKRMKEFKERERKRKEECEKNPECIKKEIQHFKKKVLKDYYLLLHFDHYQNKSDIKFKEILEYEDLLEKSGVRENYSREDLKVLKKENKRIKYILSHVDGKYRGNGVKLFVKNQKKIDELERRYPEKGFFESVINEVFDNSEDIAALEIESSAREKMQIAKNKSSSNNNVNLQEAMDLLNQAKADSSNYLKNKNPNQYPNLINLNNDIDRLEREINNNIDKLINLHKKRLFLIKRDKYQNNQFNGKPGMDLKLVKEDNEDIITVYHKGEPIGVVCKTFDSDFEKRFSDISQLQYLQKSSDAKYYFKYERFDIIEIEERTLIKEKAQFKLKLQKLINKYPKEELITIAPSIGKDIEFKQGMKFKLIKSSDSDSINVYLDNDKIGFVANNQVCNLTSKAGDIKKIPDDCNAEYLCKYEYNYHVARIINNLTPAKDYISKEEYDKAIESLDELLAEEPDNIEHRSIKCSCHNKLEQYEEVNGGNDKLIELNSNNSEYWENKASNLINMGRFDDAIDCLDDAISIDPYNPTLYSLKGTVLELKEKEELNALELKEKEELRIKQEKILKEYPKHELITITEIGNRHDFKENMTFKLIKEPYDNFIAVYLDDDKVGYVANSEDTVCDLTSDAWEIKHIPEISYAGYIMNYCEEYHIAKLMTDIRYIKKKLALEYNRKEEYSKALDCYNEVLELYPDDEYCLKRKGWVLLSLKRWNDALKFYDDIDSWGGKADVYIQMGRYEDALKCYDKIDSWSGKAEVLIKLERYDEALYCCNKIFELREPAYVRTLRELARLFIGVGRYCEAIECLDNALSQHPNESSVKSLKEYALSCLMEED